MTTQKQNTAFIFAIPSLLLAAAFIGNLFVDGWDWSGSDFVIAGILLFGTASFIYMIVSSKFSFKIKLIISIVTILILILVWMELAVGLFGTPFAGS